MVKRLSRLRITLGILITMFLAAWGSSLLINARLNHVGPPGPAASPGEAVQGPPGSPGASGIPGSPGSVTVIMPTPHVVIVQPAMQHTTTTTTTTTTVTETARPRPTATPCPFVNLKRCP